MKSCNKPLRVSGNTVLEKEKDTIHPAAYAVGENRVFLFTQLRLCT